MHFQYYYNAFNFKYNYNMSVNLNCISYKVIEGPDIFSILDVYAQNGTPLFEDNAKFIYD